MSKKFVQDGEVLDLVAPTGGVVSGLVYQIGQQLVMAMDTIAQTLKFRGKTRGVWQVTKVGTQAWTEGQIIYFDKENARFTSVATGSLLAGTAVAPLPGAGAGEVIGYVFVPGAARADEA